jgi:MFS family permease
MESPDQPEFNPSSIRAAIASWLGLFFGPNAMVSAPMSLFMVPIASEFHLNRATVSSILLLSPITTAVLTPFGGRILDRIGFRRTLLIALVVFGVTSMSRGIAQNPWELAITFALVSVGTALNSSVGYSKLITLWFSRNRGLVLGCAVALGAGAGSALAPQVVRPLIHNFGWRWAYVLSGAFMLVVVLPLMAVLLREPPARHVAGVGEVVSDQGLTRAEALRTHTFWFLGIAVFLASMALIGTNAHAVPMLTERGFDAKVAVTEISVFFIGGVVGQMTCGIIADRIDSQFVVAPYYALGLIGLLIVHITTNAALLLPGAFVMGLGQGAEIAFAAYLTSRYFGLKAYGAIYALYFGASNGGIACGLLLMGIVHDHAGSYRPMALIFGAALAIAVTLVSLMGPYRYESRRPKKILRAAATA